MKGRRRHRPARSTLEAARAAQAPAPGRGAAALFAGSEAAAQVAPTVDAVRALVAAAEAAGVPRHALGGALAEIAAEALRQAEGGEAAARHLRALAAAVDSISDGAPGA